MRIEYTELKTMMEVALAVERGEEIWYSSSDIPWTPWYGTFWKNEWRFRSLKKVRSKTVKVLAFKHQTGTITFIVEGSKDAAEILLHGDEWTRFHGADQEYEVEE